MDETSGVYTLASVLNIRDLNDHEKKFVSRIHIKNCVKDAFQVPRMVPGPCNEEYDIIDEVNSDSAWEKIRSLMGEDKFYDMWKHKFLFFEMSKNVDVSLNGRLALEDKPSCYGKKKQSRHKHIIDISKGYNPLTLVCRKPYVGKGFSGRNLIPTNFSHVCELIESQETGVPCCGVCNDITPIQSKLLKKFLKQNFSLRCFFKRLSASQKRCSPFFQIDPFVKNILKAYVPRGLIGSKKAFDRMASNICKCFETDPRFPVRLGTLMKGLPSLNFRSNVFLCKFVLFLTNVFVSSVVYKLFYVTLSLKDKKVLFFKKKIWRKFEKRALQKMVDSGVLARSSRVSYGPHVSKLRILYKTSGFRPLVKSSLRLKRFRFRLSVCNAFLKQLVNQINPGYGHVLNALHSQWNNLNSVNCDRLYFIRTDVSDAFQSIIHSKLLEILNRRLSAMDPVQTCRTFEYKCGMRKKSVLQFTKVGPKLHKKTIFCEAGKKVYTTSYLKALIIQYIKQNYVSMNGRDVFQQTRGLPQGCCLSSILCELYLADMDDCYFNHLKSEKDVLIRGVDDYVFMTTDPYKANTFLEGISNGICDYGITFQQTKTITNFSTPVTCFPFFGYIFYPKCRTIEPNFSEWTDNAITRMYLNPKMTWDDLTRRMKMVIHIKLHGLILDSNYLHKFALMKNVYLCSKVHASKYKVMYNFLTENGNSYQPSLRESLRPIIAAASTIAFKVVSINKDKNVLSHHEVKIVVLKGFETVLGPTGPFRSLCKELRVITGRILSTGRSSNRFRKLLKSLVKNV